MKSPFRVRRTLDYQEDEYEDINAQPFHDAPNRTRNDTGTSWHGSFCQDATPPKAKAAISVSRILKEETANVVIYLAGSTALRVVFHYAKASMTAASILAELNPTTSSLECFLQAAWLYQTSTMSTKTTAAGSGSISSNQQPLLSARIASWRLGRLQWQELAVIALIHLTLLIAHGYVISIILELSDDVSRFSIVSYLQSLLQSTVCVVLLLVGPTILQINRLHPSLVVLLLRPPSLLAPFTIARMIETLMSQVVAGLVAGKVLESYFPDDPMF